MRKTIETHLNATTPPAGGFTIIETVIAMLVITIAMLGALQAINYSILYNAGNATRAQNLAILQQEVERMRAAKFTPTGVDAAALPGGGGCRTDAQRDISGGAKTPCTVDAPNGGKFLVTTSVDNDPFNAAGTYDTTPADPPNANFTRQKEITIQVEVAAPNPGWQMAIPARVVIRRTIGN
ncbi:MAG: prepilin-type N-terminal cleavage/methylation domain-containing protein [Acidobacteriota bacterium]